MMIRPFPNFLATCLAFMLSGPLSADDAPEETWAGAVRWEDVELTPGGAAAFRRDAELFIALDRLPESKEVRLPRLRNRLISLGWHGEREPQDQSPALTLVPEPASWVIRIQRPPRTGLKPVISLMLDAAPRQAALVISQSADRSTIELPAHLANVHGERLRYEPQSHKNTLGYWTNPEDWAAWTFEAKLAGTYHVDVWQGCGPGQGGSEVDILLRTEGESPSLSTVSFQVEETSHFQDFRKRRIGTLAVPRAGRYVIEVRPRVLAHKAVMDLRSVVLTAVEPAEAGNTDWKAGVAKRVITPQTAVWLAGYGSKRVPDGKLHELWMKALALEDAQGNQAVLITSDFQGVPKVMSDRVFTELRQRYGLERRQVMFTFSHNHCGPRLGDDLVDYYPVEEDQVALVEEYTTLMVTETVAMVGEALSKLAPARLAQGEGRATFAVNRRNNREADVPALLERGEPLVGPVDHSVPVLTVSRPDGGLEAILFGYACHPTTLSFTKWCGDYPGFAQLEIESRHPGAIAMFVNTCGGDQNPLPRRTVELCEKYGKMLAAAVEEVLTQPLRPVSPGVKTAFMHVDLPYLKVVSREELEAASRESHAIRARWAARLLKKLEAGEEFPTAYPYPLHAWRLGNEMLVIGMGAETVVDYALRFKQEFGPGTWVCGYADDMISYIPSRRVWEEGGYEGGSSLFEYGRPAFRWSGEIEDRIAEAVHQLVKQVE